MDNINGFNIPNTSTYNKNVPTKPHTRLLEAPTWRTGQAIPPLYEGQNQPTPEGRVPACGPPGRGGRCMPAGLGVGLRVGVGRTQGHRRPGGRIKSCGYQQWAQVQCSVLWPQETKWRNDLGPLFPELLELCHITGLRSLGQDERRSEGGGGHLGVRVS